MHPTKSFATAGLMLASTLAVAQPAPPVGAVYTMTNAVEGNAVQVYQRRSVSQNLRPGPLVPTGGLGSGGSLGNQNGLLLDPDNRHLYAVNAGSDDVSVFTITPTGLELKTRFPSGGQRPVSVARFGGLLCVLNAGGSVGSIDNVACRRWQPEVDDAAATAVGLESESPHYATAVLSAADTAPAQIQFTRDGRYLVATEKATNRISTYQVGLGGEWRNGEVTLHRVGSFDSAGRTPFGFDVGNGNQIIVSEAMAGDPEAGAVSSYRVEDDGSLSWLQGTQPVFQTATCWVAVGGGGRYAYVSNTGSDNVSVLRVGFDGELDLLGRFGAVRTVGTTPLDVSISQDGLNFYVLNAGSGSINAFTILPNGRLERLGQMRGLPNSANGLAAR